MGNTEIIVRMDEYRLNKLEACLALQDSSVLQRLKETLAQLYAEYVPTHIRQGLEDAIRQERQAKETQQRAERRIAVIHLHDAENNCHNQDRVRKKASDGTLGEFAECFGLYQFIDPILYDAFKETLPNAKRIQTIAEFDFERQALHTYSLAEKAWHTYLLKDVSSAVFRAMRKSILPSAQKEVFYALLAARRVD